MNLNFIVNKNREISVSPKSLSEKYDNLIQKMNKEFKNALLQIDTSDILLNEKDLKNTLTHITGLKTGQHYYTLVFDHNNIRYYQKIHTFDKNTNKNELKELAKKGFLSVSKKILVFQAERKNLKINKFARPVFAKLITQNLSPAANKEQNLKMEL